MVNVIPITTSEQLKEAHRIRKVVFVEEQNCPPELEYEHEDESHHFLASFNSTPAGTARWRATDKGYKLERFAVLKDLRGKHIGEALLKTIIENVPKDGKMIYLHAQVSAKEFYLKYGFAPVGENFWEAGIEHTKMKLIM